MTALASAISLALIHFVWQGAVLGLSLWIVLSTLSRHAARWRYLASCAALILMGTVPLATTWFLYWQPPALISITAPANLSGTPVAAPMQIPAATVWLSWLKIWALPVWSFGVLLFSARLVLGYRHAFLLKHRGKPAGSSVVEVVTRLSRLMRVHRPVRVLISSMSESPSVVGWLRPVILLPTATLIGLTPLQLEAILAHEIGHIKRYDYLVNILQMVVETLLFYHPAVWWATKRIRIEREMCCDDLAVRFSGNALRYARALTVLEKLRLRTSGVAMASMGGSLLDRIQRLVGASNEEHGSSRLPVMLAAGIGILCFALNVTWIRGQDAPGVKVDLGSSSVIHRAPVRYPEVAKRQGITGTVQLEATLDAAGNVADARVLTGPEELRKAAIESVLNWHFTSDAARSTRVIAISFSEEGTHVQIGERRTLYTGIDGKSADEAARRLEEAKAAVAQAADRAKEQELKAVGIARQQLEGELETLQQQLRGVTAAGDVNQANLQARIVELRAVLEATRPAGGRIPEELAALEQQLRSLAAAGNADQDRLKAQVVQLRAQLEATPRSSGNGRGGSIFTDRVLKGVSTLGLSDSVRSDLIARLPVREGDILSPKMLEQTAAAVRSYDEHLRVQFIVNNDGKVELRITAPGERQ